MWNEGELKRGLDLGESYLASICGCMQDFYLSPTLLTFSLSLLSFSFKHLFIYAKLVAFPVPDPNPAPKSLRGKFSPSDKAPALQISFLRNLFHLLSLPIQTEKKNPIFFRIPNHHNGSSLSCLLQLCVSRSLPSLLAYDPHSKRRR